MVAAYNPFRSGGSRRGRVRRRAVPAAGADPSKLSPLVAPLFSPADDILRALEPRILLDASIGAAAVGVADAVDDRADEGEGDKPITAVVEREERKSKERESKRFKRSPPPADPAAEPVEESSAAPEILSRDRRSSSITVSAPQVNADLGVVIQGENLDIPRDIARGAWIATFVLSGADNYLFTDSVLVRDEGKTYADWHRGFKFSIEGNRLILRRFGGPEPPNQILGNEEISLPTLLEFKSYSGAIGEKNFFILWLRSPTFETDNLQKVTAKDSSENALTVTVDANIQTVTPADSHSPAGTDILIVSDQASIAADKFLVAFTISDDTLGAVLATKEQLEAAGKDGTSNDWVDLSMRQPGSGLTLWVLRTKTGGDAITDGGVRSVWFIDSSGNLLEVKIEIRLAARAPSVAGDNLPVTVPDEPTARSEGGANVKVRTDLTSLQDIALGDDASGDPNVILEFLMSGFVTGIAPEALEVRTRTVTADNINDNDYLAVVATITDGKLLIRRDTTVADPLVTIAQGGRRLIEFTLSDPRDSSNTEITITVTLGEPYDTFGVTQPDVGGTEFFESPPPDDAGVDTHYWRLNNADGEIEVTSGNVEIIKVRLFGKDFEGEERDSDGNPIAAADSFFDVVTPAAGATDSEGYYIYTIRLLKDLKSTDGSKTLILQDGSDQITLHIEVGTTADITFSDPQVNTAAGVTGDVSTTANRVYDILVPYDTRAGVQLLSLTLGGGAGYTFDDGSTRLDDNDYVLMSIEGDKLVVRNRGPLSLAALRTLEQRIFINVLNFRISGVGISIGNFKSISVEYIPPLLFDTNSISKPTSSENRASGVGGDFGTTAVDPGIRTVRGPDAFSPPGTDILIISDQASITSTFGSQKMLAAFKFDLNLFSGVTVPVDLNSYISGGNIVIYLVAVDGQPARSITEPGLYSLRFGAQNLEVKVEIRLAPRAPTIADNGIPYVPIVPAALVRGRGSADFTVTTDLAAFNTAAHTEDGGELPSILEFYLEDFSGGSIPESFEIKARDVTDADPSDAEYLDVEAKKEDGKVKIRLKRGSSRITIGENERRKIEFVLSDPGDDSKKLTITVNLMPPPKAAFTEVAAPAASHANIDANEVPGGIAVSDPLAFGTDILVTTTDDSIAIGKVLAVITTSKVLTLNGPRGFSLERIGNTNEYKIVATADITNGLTVTLRVADTKTNEHLEIRLEVRLNAREPTLKAGAWPNMPDAMPSGPKKDAIGSEAYPGISAATSTAGAAAYTITTDVDNLNDYANELDPYGDQTGDDDLPYILEFDYSIFSVAAALSSIIVGTVDPVAGGTDAKDSTHLKVIVVKDLADNKLRIKLDKAAAAALRTISGSAASGTPRRVIGFTLTDPGDSSKRLTITITYAPATVMSVTEIVSRPQYSIIPVPRDPTTQPYYELTVNFYYDPDFLPPTGEANVIFRLSLPNIVNQATVVFVRSPSPFDVIASAQEASIHIDPQGVSELRAGVSGTVEVYLDAVIGLSDPSVVFPELLRSSTFRLNFKPLPYQAPGPDQQPGVSDGKFLEQPRASDDAFNERAWQLTNADGQITVTQGNPEDIIRVKLGSNSFEEYERDDDNNPIGDTENYFELTPLAGGATADGDGYYLYTIKLLKTLSNTDGRKSIFLKDTISGLIIKLHIGVDTTKQTDISAPTLGSGVTYGDSSAAGVEGVIGMPASVSDIPAGDIIASFVLADGYDHEVTADALAAVNGLTASIENGKLVIRRLATPATIPRTLQGDTLQQIGFDVRGKGILTTRFVFELEIVGNPEFVADSVTTVTTSDATAIADPHITASEPDRFSADGTHILVTSTQNAVAANTYLASFKVRDDTTMRIDPNADASAIYSLVAVATPGEYKLYVGSQVTRGFVGVLALVDGDGNKLNVLVEIRLAPRTPTPDSLFKPAIPAAAEPQTVTEGDAPGRFTVGADLTVLNTYANTQTGGQLPFILEIDMSNHLETGISGRALTVTVRQPSAADNYLKIEAVKSADGQYVRIRLGGADPNLRTIDANGKNTIEFTLSDPRDPDNTKFTITIVYEHKLPPEITAVEAAARQADVTTYEIDPDLTVGKTQAQIALGDLIPDDYVVVNSAGSSIAANTVLAIFTIVDEGEVRLDEASAAKGFHLERVGDTDQYKLITTKTLESGLLATLTIVDVDNNELPINLMVFLNGRTGIRIKDDALPTVLAPDLMIPPDGEDRLVSVEDTGEQSYRTLVSVVVDKLNTYANTLTDGELPFILEFDIDDFLSAEPASLWTVTAWVLGSADPNDGSYLAVEVVPDFAAGKLRIRLDKSAAEALRTIALTASGRYRIQFSLEQSVESGTGTDIAVSLGDAADETELGYAVSDTQPTDGNFFAQVNGKRWTIFYKKGATLDGSSTPIDLFSLDLIKSFFGRAGDYELRLTGDSGIDMISRDGRFTLRLVEDIADIADGDEKTVTIVERLSGGSAVTGMEIQLTITFDELPIAYYDALPFTGTISIGSAAGGTIVLVARGANDPVNVGVIRLTTPDGRPREGRVGSPGALWRILENVALPGTFSNVLTRHLEFRHGFKQFNIVAERAFPRGGGRYSLTTRDSTTGVEVTFILEIVASTPQSVPVRELQGQGAVAVGAGDGSSGKPYQVRVSVNTPHGPALTFRLSAADAAAGYAIKSQDVTPLTNANEHNMRFVLDGDEVSLLWGSVDPRVDTPKVITLTLSAPGRVDKTIYFKLGVVSGRDESISAIGGGKGTSGNPMIFNMVVNAVSPFRAISNRFLTVVSRDDSALAPENRDAVKFRRVGNQMQLQWIPSGDEVVDEARIAVFTIKDSNDIERTIYVSVEALAPGPAPPRIDGLASSAPGAFTDDGGGSRGSRADPIVIKVPVDYRSPAILYTTRAPPKAGWGDGVRLVSKKRGGLGDQNWDAIDFVVVDGTLIVRWVPKGDEVVATAEEAIARVRQLAVNGNDNWNLQFAVEFTEPAGPSPKIPSGDISDNIISVDDDRGGAEGNTIRVFYHHRIAADKVLAVVTIKEENANWDGMTIGGFRLKRLGGTSYDYAIYTTAAITDDEVTQVLTLTDNDGNTVTINLKLVKDTQPPKPSLPSAMPADTKDALSVGARTVVGQYAVVVPEIGFLNTYANTEISGELPVILEFDLNEGIFSGWGDRPRLELKTGEGYLEADLFKDGNKIKVRMNREVTDAELRTISAARDKIAFTITAMDGSESLDIVVTYAVAPEITAVETAERQADVTTYEIDPDLTVTEVDDGDGVTGNSIIVGGAYEFIAANTVLAIFTIVDEGEVRLDEASAAKGFHLERVGDSDQYKLITTKKIEGGLVTTLTITDVDGNGIPVKVDIRFVSLAAKGDPIVYVKLKEGAVPIALPSALSGLVVAGDNPGEFKIITDFNAFTVYANALGVVGVDAPLPFILFFNLKDFFTRSYNTFSLVDKMTGSADALPVVTERVGDVIGIKLSPSADPGTGVLGSSRNKISLRASDSGAGISPVVVDIDIIFEPDELGYAASTVQPTNADFFAQDMTARDAAAGEKSWTIFYKEGATLDGSSTPINLFSLDLVKSIFGRAGNYELRLSDDSASGIDMISRDGRFTLRLTQDIAEGPPKTVTIVERLSGGAVTDTEIQLKITFKELSTAYYNNLPYKGGTPQIAAIHGTLEQLPRGANDPVNMAVFRFTTPDGRIDPGGGAGSDDGGSWPLLANMGMRGTFSTVSTPYLLFVGLFKRLEIWADNALSRGGWRQPITVRDSTTGVEITFIVELVASTPQPVPVRDLQGQGAVEVGSGDGGQATPYQVRLPVNTPHGAALTFKLSATDAAAGYTIKSQDVTPLTNANEHNMRFVLDGDEVSLLWGADAPVVDTPKVITLTLSAPDQLDKTIRFSLEIAAVTAAPPQIEGLASSAPGPSVDTGGGSRGSAADPIFISVPVNSAPADLYITRAPPAGGWGDGVKLVSIDLSALPAENRDAIEFVEVNGTLIMRWDPSGDEVASAIKTVVVRVSVLDGSRGYNLQFDIKFTERGGPYVHIPANDISDNIVSVEDDDGDGTEGNTIKVLYRDRIAADKVLAVVTIKEENADWDGMTISGFRLKRLGASYDYAIYSTAEITDDEVTQVLTLTDNDGNTVTINLKLAQDTTAPTPSLPSALPEALKRRMSVTPGDGRGQFAAGAAIADLSAYANREISGELPVILEFDLSGDIFSDWGDRPRLELKTGEGYLQADLFKDGDKIKVRMNREVTDAELRTISASRDKIAFTITSMDGSESLDIVVTYTLSPEITAAETAVRQADVTTYEIDPDITVGKTQAQIALGDAIPDDYVVVNSAGSSIAANTILAIVTIVDEGEVRLDEASAAKGFHLERVGDTDKYKLITTKTIESGFSATLTITNANGNEIPLDLMVFLNGRTGIRLKDGALPTVLAPNLMIPPDGEDSLVSVEDTGEQSYTSQVSVVVDKLNTYANTPTDGELPFILEFDIDDFLSAEPASLWTVTAWVLGGADPNDGEYLAVEVVPDIAAGKLRIRLDKNAIEASRTIALTALGRYRIQFSLEQSVESGTGTHITVSLGDAAAETNLGYAVSDTQPTDANFFAQETTASDAAANEKSWTIFYKRGATLDGSPKNPIDLFNLDLVKSLLGRSGDYELRLTGDSGIDMISRGGRFTLRLVEDIDEGDKTVTIVERLGGGAVSGAEIQLTITFKELTTGDYNGLPYTGGSVVGGFVAVPRGANDPINQAVFRMTTSDGSLSNSQIRQVIDRVRLPGTGWQFRRSESSDKFDQTFEHGGNNSVFIKAGASFPRGGGRHLLVYRDTDTGVEVTFIFELVARDPPPALPQIEGLASSAPGPFVDDSAGNPATVVKVPLGFPAADLSFGDFASLTGTNIRVTAPDLSAFAPQNRDAIEFVVVNGILTLRWKPSGDEVADSAKIVSMSIEGIDQSDIIVAIDLDFNLEIVEAPSLKVPSGDISDNIVLVEDDDGDGTEGNTIRVLYHDRIAANKVLAVVTIREENANWDGMTIGGFRLKRLGTSGTSGTSYDYAIYTTAEITDEAATRTLTLTDNDGNTVTINLKFVKDTQPPKASLPDEMAAGPKADTEIVVGDGRGEFTITTDFDNLNAYASEKTPYGDVTGDDELPTILEFDLSGELLSGWGDRPRLELKTGEGYLQVDLFKEGNTIKVRMNREVTDEEQRTISAARNKIAFTITAMDGADPLDIVVTYEQGGKIGYSVIAEPSPGPLLTVTRTPHDPKTQRYDERAWVIYYDPASWDAPLARDDLELFRFSLDRAGPVSTSFSSTIEYGSTDANWQAALDLITIRNGVYALNLDHVPLAGGALATLKQLIESGAAAGQTITILLTEGDGGTEYGVLRVRVSFKAIPYFPASSQPALDLDGDATQRQARELPPDSPGERNWEIPRAQEKGVITLVMGSALDVIYVDLASEGFAEVGTSEYLGVKRDSSQDTAASGSSPAKYRYIIFLKKTFSSDDGGQSIILTDPAEGALRMKFSVEFGYADADTGMVVIPGLPGSVGGDGTYDNPFVTTVPADVVTGGLFALYAIDSTGFEAPLTRVVASDLAALDDANEPYFRFTIRNRVLWLDRIEGVTPKASLQMDAARRISVIVAGENGEIGRVSFTLQVTAAAGAIVPAVVDFFAPSALSFLSSGAWLNDDEIVGDADLAITDTSDDDINGNDIKVDITSTSIAAGKAFLVMSDTR